MPAIANSEAPDGVPVSIFEGGALLQYRARKTGGFGGVPGHDRIAVGKWLMWQMRSVGPMAGQCHHVLKYPLQMGHDIPYAKNRYRTKTAWLYAVLNRQLAKNELANNECVAGDYSIAAIAICRQPSSW